MGVQSRNTRWVSELRYEGVRKPGEFRAKIHGSSKLKDRAVQN